MDMVLTAATCSCSIYVLPGANYTLSRDEPNTKVGTRKPGCFPNTRPSQRRVSTLG